MIISKIRNELNRLTPGMTFKRYAKQVLYHGQNCGYIEEAGKRKYVLTPAIEKLEHKLELNNFQPNCSRYINNEEFNTFKILLKPFVKNEKGLKTLDKNRNLYYTAGKDAIMILDKVKFEPVVMIVKKLKFPTSEIIFHRFPILRKLIRISPERYL